MGVSITWTASVQLQKEKPHLHKIWYFHLCTLLFGRCFFSIIGAYVFSLYMKSCFVAKKFDFKLQPIIMVLFFFSKRYISRWVRDFKPFPWISLVIIPLVANIPSTFFAFFELCMKKISMERQFYGSFCFTKLIPLQNNRARIFNSLVIVRGIKHSSCCLIIAFFCLVERPFTLIMNALLLRCHHNDSEMFL